MSEGWATVALGDVIKRVARPERLNPEINYRILGAHWYAEGLFIKDLKTGGQIQADTAYRVEEGDFVYNRLFAWKGSFAIAGKDHNGCYVSNEFPCFTVKDDLLDVRYLWRYLGRASAWAEALGMSSGGTPTSRNRLKEEQFIAMRMPLPPLDEQRRIVRRIDELAAKIEEARKLRGEVNEGCDALCRSIIFDEVAETMPVAMRELVRWKETDVSVSRNETYHFAGVYCFGKGVFKGHRKAGIEFAYSRLSRLQAGNFVYPKLMAWEGALGVVPPECDGLVVSPEFPVFEVDESRVLPEVLDVYFRTPSVWSKLSDTSTGTNVRRRRLNPSDFLSFKMPLPSMAAQQKLREVKRGVDAIKDMQTETAAALDALLPSVLDKAFKGEL